VVNKNISIGKVRGQGYMDALAKHNLFFDDQLVIDCSQGEKENYTIIQNALKKTKADAVFSSVERLALASYHVCNDMKIHIPKDLKIISFSSLHIAPLLCPPLSTITQPAHEMGIKAAELLFEELENKGAGSTKKHIMLKSKLFIRTSSSVV
jgi:LacI family transcriptional regulator